MTASPWRQRGVDRVRSYESQSRVFRPEVYRTFKVDDSTKNNYTWDRPQMRANCLATRIYTQSLIMSVAFLIFNVVDAYLTQLNLAMGATEVNPFAEPFGSNMLVRGLLALAVVALTVSARKVRWLLYLNVLVLWVVVWNLWQHVGAECGWLPFR